MPIAICYTKDTKLDKKKIDSFVSQWAENIGVHISDVSLTILQNSVQSGQQYDVLCNLHLPSLWSAENIENIQN